jgi:hypothetical protein
LQSQHPCFRITCFSVVITASIFQDITFFHYNHSIHVSGYNFLPLQSQHPCFRI